MLNPPAALLFDLDGTLVDSAPDLAAAVNAALLALGRDAVSESTVRGWVGQGASMLLTRALFGSEVCEDSELLQRGLAAFMAYYQAHVCVQSRLYPGVAAGLRQLSHLPLACVTNKPAAFVPPLLAQLGLAEVFGCWAGGDSLAQKKPHPLPLQWVAQQLGVAVTECWMVGDSRADIAAAQAAGCPVIGVSYGYNQGVSLSEIGASCVVDQFADLVALVLNQPGK